MGRDTCGGVVLSWAVALATVSCLRGSCRLRGVVVTSAEANRLQHGVKLAGGSTLLGCGAGDACGCRCVFYLLETAFPSFDATIGQFKRGEGDNGG